MWQLRRTAFSGGVRRFYPRSHTLSGVERANNVKTKPIENGEPTNWDGTRRTEAQQDERYLQNSRRVHDRLKQKHGAASSKVEVLN